MQAIDPVDSVAIRRPSLAAGGPLCSGSCRPAAPACSSSSIGKDSDCSGEAAGGGSEEPEVQSSYQGRQRQLPGLDDLEEALPVRRGISAFYDGRSKSFTHLSDTASLSAKDLTKGENMYTRKRKNRLAFSLMYKVQSAISLAEQGACPKRLTGLGRTALKAIGSDDSINSSTSYSSEEHELPERIYTPGFHRTSTSLTAGSVNSLKLPSMSMRSMSVTDLQLLHTAKQAVHLADKLKAE